MFEARIRPTLIHSSSPSPATEGRLRLESVERLSIQRWKIRTKQIVNLVQNVGAVLGPPGGHGFGRASCVTQICSSQIKRVSKLHASIRRLWPPWVIFLQRPRTTVSSSLHQSRPSFIHLSFCIFEPRRVGKGASMCPLTVLFNRPCAEIAPGSYEHHAVHTLNGLLFGTSLHILSDKGSK